MFGNRIKEARIAASLSQAELAELCGWDETRQSEYELGKYQLNFDQLELIAKHTNLATSSLVGIDASSRDDSSESVDKLDQVLTDRQKAFIDNVLALSDSNFEALYGVVSAMKLSDQQKIKD